MNKQEFWTYINDCIDLTANEYGCSYCPAKAYYDELNVACPARSGDYCSGICRDVYEKIEAQERARSAKAMAIDEWIKLLADRSKFGNIGEYFHRKQCAELLEFLVELKYYRKLTERDEDGEK